MLTELRSNEAVRVERTDNQHLCIHNLLAGGGSERPEHVAQAVVEFRNDNPTLMSPPLTVSNDQWEMVKSSCPSFDDSTCHVEIQSSVFGKLHPKLVKVSRERWVELKKWFDKVL